MNERKQTNTNNSILNDAVLKELDAASKSLKYGHILITVHNSRIVQIDKTEKIRFDATTYYEKGDGI
jgi:hypothetical protein